MDSENCHRSRNGGAGCEKQIGRKLFSEIRGRRVSACGRSRRRRNLNSRGSNTKIKIFRNRRKCSPNISPAMPMKTRPIAAKPVIGRRVIRKEREKSTKPVRFMTAVVYRYGANWYGYIAAAEIDGSARSRAMSNQRRIFPPVR